MFQEREDAHSHKLRLEGDACMHYRKGVDC